MPTLSDLLDIPSGSVLLIDIDVLFTPVLKLDVHSQLHRLVRGRSLVVLWPGRVQTGRLSYSLPGRDDYVDVQARNIIVLRPITTQFPDEVPYLLERMSA